MQLEVEKNHNASIAKTLRKIASCHDPLQHNVKPLAGD